MKNIFTFLMLLLGTATAFAQFSEDFEGDLSDWVIEDGWVVGTSASNSSQYFTVPDGSLSIVMNDDAVGPDVILSGSFISPTFLVPDSELVTIEFERYFRNGDYQGDETAKVLVSTDGVNFTEVADLAGNDNQAWEVSSVGLGDYANQEIQVAFAYDDGGSWNYGFAVDNIGLSEALLLDAKALGGTTTCLDAAYVGKEVGFYVQVENNGLTEINSMDLTVTIGGNTITENVTGIAIAPASSYVHNIDGSLAVEAGTSSVSVEVSNVNGSDDGDLANNSVSFDITGYEFAEDRGVFVEEATGTWCTFCPRGAIFMDLLKECADQAFVGVAVHNGDPMVVTEYDNAIQVGGYPSALYERNTEIDPSQLFGPVFDRATEATPVKLRAGADVDGNNFQLTVEAHANVAMNGNYKFLAVISEDGVTGTNSGYAQTNYLSGSGAPYPYDWYANQPSPVPASAMVYNEVARALIGGYTGEAATITDLAAGEIFSHHFDAITLPSGMNLDKVVINFVLFDNSGEVVNAWKQTYNETLDFVLSADDAIINASNVAVSPNPTSGDATLVVSLEETADVTVDVIDVTGRIVSSTVLNKQNGTITVPVAASTFESGMYFVNVKAGNAIVTKRLVVNN